MKQKKNEPAFYIKSPHGEGQCKVPLDTVAIPDLWNAATFLKRLASGEKFKFDKHNRELCMCQSEEILEVWHLAHDLLATMKESSKKQS